MKLKIIVFVLAVVLLTPSLSIQPIILLSDWNLWLYDSTTLTNLTE